VEPPFFLALRFVLCECGDVFAVRVHEQTRAINAYANLPWIPLSRLRVRDIFQRVNEDHIVIPAELADAAL
jgi:hypothetical protein